ncbi:ATP synthase F0 subunit 8 (mitochondrion) [Erpetoichthys calabaricus]|uniref:ATP synthase complex subunit 8 n=1 Tax=Erpetoichthys calabaricus TaxID=27687 RepID=Q6T227_ERPCA|nr:ATP synthase F0 subunit 8 [Erpetoichthys calabaricus]AAR16107.1 ATPase8 [Erpetoichthys calabaricus]
MPQLNPDPWFVILIFTWTVFLTILPNKITFYKIPNEPLNSDPLGSNMDTWSWPWY